VFDIGLFNLLKFNVPQAQSGGIAFDADKLIQYLAALKTDYTPITRIEFLYPDGSVAYRLDDNVLQAGSAINVAQQVTGARRTGTLVLDNWRQIYNLHPDQIWFGQQIRVSKGLYLPDGSEYVIQQGTFYISNPQQAFAPTERTNTISLIDKWAYLDGTLFGYVPGTYILNVGDNLFTAAKGILTTDRGNGTAIDATPPMFSSEYIGLQYAVDAVNYNYLDCPYTAKKKGAYADVMSEIATMLVGSVWYDASGRMRITRLNSVDDTLKPVLWNFDADDLDRELVRVNIVQHPEKVYNHVVVTGGVLNGRVAKGEAYIEDPRSALSVSRIGRKTAPLDEQSKYFADAHCQERAEYLLKQYSRMAEEATIECSPMFHLQEDCLVTVIRKDLDGMRAPYLINGWSLPLTNTGTMTINAVKLAVPTAV